jgi:hypothetical protein
VRAAGQGARPPATAFRPVFPMPNDRGVLARRQ